MNATISALVWCAIQVTVLTCGVAVVYLAARRVHPRAGAAAAGGGLLMVLALTVMLASPWPRWKFERDTTQIATTTSTPSEVSKADTAEMPTEVASTSPRENVARVPSYWSLLIDAINHPAGRPPIKSAVVENRTAPRWPALIAVALFGGALLAAARLTWGVMAVRRFARSGRLIDDRRLVALVRDLQERLDLQDELAVREVEGLSTPATVGWRRPVVLLPTAWREWSDAELRAVIAHELAHIAGRDYAVWFVARLAVVAHFYHPLVRWLAARLQLEQELAADMTAARLLGDSKAYLHSLASLALSMPPNRMTGPARTLFPSRSLLVRRVEMLRTNGITRSRSRGARYATFAVVAIVGLAAAGLRGPGIEFTSRAVAQPPANETPPAKVDKVERIGLEVVPLDAIYALSVRVAELADDPKVGPLVRSLTERAPQLTGTKLTASDVAEVLFVPYGSIRGPQNVRIVLRFQSPELKQRFAAWYESSTGAKAATEPRIWTDGSNSRLGVLDDSTVVFDQFVQNGGKESPPLENVAPRWAAAWKERKDELVLAALDVPADLLKELKAAAGSPHAPTWLLTAQSLGDADWVVADLQLGDVLKVEAIAQCKGDAGAKGVAETMQALMVIMRDSVRAYRGIVQQNAGEIPQAAVYQRLLAEADSALGTAEFGSNASQVKATMHTTISTIDAAKLAMAALLPSIEQASSAARSTRSMNNLKQLALSMHIFLDTYKSFPPAVSYKYRVGKETRTSEYPHSWRIDVLPFLEQQPLYDRYHFDEPWDSEANKKVLAEMPAQFRSPFDPDQASTNTSYFVFAGKDAAFSGKEGAKIRQFTDGLSKTLMLVEAKRPVPWTKPEDIDYAADQPVPKIEGWQRGQFLVALCDGSTHSVASDIDEATLRAFITKSGREPVGQLPKPKSTSP